MHTAITELLDIEFPILAFSHCRDVVAAVSKAGGLGVLGAVAHSPEQLQIDLDWIEHEIGHRHYGVDLIVPARYAGDEEGGYSIDDIRHLIPGELQAFVDDILRRYEVPERVVDRDAGDKGVSALGVSMPPHSRQPQPVLNSRSHSRTGPPSSQTRSVLRRSS